MKKTLIKTGLCLSMLFATPAFTQTGVNPQHPQNLQIPQEQTAQQATIEQMIKEAREALQKQTALQANPILLTQQIQQVQQAIQEVMQQINQAQEKGKQEKGKQERDQQWQKEMQKQGQGHANTPAPESSSGAKGSNNPIKMNQN
jgi:hypothetical protein